MILLVLFYETDKCSIKMLFDNVFQLIYTLAIDYNYIWFSQRLRCDKFKDDDDDGGGGGGCDKFKDRALKILFLSIFFNKILKRTVSITILLSCWVVSFYGSFDFTENNLNRREISFHSVYF